MLAKSPFRRHLNSDYDVESAHSKEQTNDMSHVRSGALPNLASAAAHPNSLPNKSGGPSHQLQPSGIDHEASLSAAPSFDAGSHLLRSKLVKRVHPTQATFTIAKQIKKEGAQEEMCNKIEWGINDESDEGPHAHGGSDDHSRIVWGD
jgi:hypothetical protein